MRSHEWDAMNDKDFETMLARSVSELAPDDIVTKVTPWKKGMNRALTGIAIATIRLDVWYLSYILLAIGTVLTLLGFRTLRHENKWFGCCYVLSVIKTAYVFLTLVCDTTIWQSSILASNAGYVLRIADWALLFLIFICLWRGFLSVQKKAGLSSHAGGAAALIVWFALMCLLALAPYQSILIIGPMLVGYILIIRSLYKLSRELDEAGYVIHAAPVRVTDCRLVISLVLFLLVGAACGYTFGGSYPMEWTALDADEHADVADTKAHLISLGFPASVLDDLNAKDIAACEDALQVVVDITDWPMDIHRKAVSAKYRSSDNGIIVEDTDSGAGDAAFDFKGTASDTETIRITNIGVQVPGAKNRWIIFHHFLWPATSGFYGTESIQLWPAYQLSPEEWRSAGEVTGRILHDRNGETFSSDYYFLGTQTFTDDSIICLRESRTNTDIFATFSMPHNSGHQRGYLTYPVDGLQDGGTIDSWFNYTHQRSWMQFPALTAMENRMTADRNDAGAFKTIQDSFVFSTTESSY